ncbi:MAG: hypothetical protein HFI68_07315 [Lachnospiraceae bacterium]|nr:hypothetical protein [Lachnospiraceae bacterium]
MYVNRTKKNPYTKQTVFDVLSAVVGLAVIAVGIVSFINLEKNAWLFPVVFLLAAIFQCLLGIPRMMGGYGRTSKRRKATGVGLFVLAGILLMLGVVSALCLWR